MAGVIGTAFVDVRPDMTGFGRDVQTGMAKAEGNAEEAGKRTGGAFSGGFKQTALGVAAGQLIANFALQAGAKITEFVGGSITAASDLSETLNKVGVVFGDSAGQVTDWSKNAATAFGLSRNEALTSAATFGDMFSQLGLGKKDAAGASEGMIKLASDLGSFHNVDPSDVLERLSSAFRGEYDPIQKLIPGITAARVEHEALRTTGKKSASDLTALDKALATQAILMGDSANATNDFAETSGGLANQQRIASAQFKDLQAKLGQLLLPALTAVTQVLNTALLPALTAVFNWISDHKDVVAALAIGLAAVGVVILISLVPAFIAWAGAALAAAAATLLAVWPLLLIGAVVAALAYVIIKNWDTVKAATVAVWNAILGAVHVVWDWISANWPWLLAILAGPFGIAAKLILDNWQSILGFFKGLPGMILGFLSGAATWLVNTGRSVMQGLISGAQNAVSGLWSWLSGLPATIISMLGNVGRMLWDSGVKIIQGLIDGMLSMVHKVTDTIGNIAGSITSHLPFSPAKEGPLHDHPPFEAGQTIVRDLAAGMARERAAVAAGMSLVTAGAVGLVGGLSVPALTGALPGAGVRIDQVVVAAPVDVDLLVGRLSAAVNAGRL